MKTVADLLRYVAENGLHHDAELWVIHATFTGPYAVADFDANVNPGQAWENDLFLVVR